LATTSFVRVACPACSRGDVFLTCNACQRREGFTLEEARVVCACGAGYDHAVCVCGAKVPRAGLLAVPFEQGPVSLSDFELDPRKLALVGGLVLAVLAGLGWLLLS
jgi:hypothetical protein